MPVQIQRPLWVTLTGLDCLSAISPAGRLKLRGAHKIIMTTKNNIVKSRITRVTIENGPSHEI
jgi:hypothetical protein